MGKGSKSGILGLGFGFVSKELADLGRGSCFASPCISFPTSKEEWMITLPTYNKQTCCQG